MMFPILLLAGGLATRMRPITEKTPKSMLEIDGNPFIYYQLRKFYEQGFKHVVLCVGYLGEIIEEYVKTQMQIDMKIDFSYDGDKLLGTGGAVKKALKFLPDSFFVQYGDSYLDVDYAKIQDSFTKSDKDVLMTVYKNDDCWDTSNIIYKDNEILKYSKNEKSSEMNYIDYGVSILTQKAIKAIPDDTFFDLSEVLEQLAMQRKLAAFLAENRFYEIGSKEGYEELKLLISKNITMN